MNFDLDEDQRLLKAGIERFVADRYGGEVERRRGYRQERAGFSQDNWQLLAELGVLAIPFAEEDGGLGGGLPELMIAGEALGEGMVAEPWLETAVLAGGVLDKAGSPAQKEEWLTGLIGGGTRLALAWAETAGRYRHDAPGTRLADGRLKGRKTFVPAAAGADGFIVTAREDGEFALAIVRADAEGLSSREYRLIDGSIAAELELNDAPAEPLPGKLAAFEAALVRTRVAATAEMVGLASLLHRQTLDYARQRRQFGVPIGSFQALQHRMVDGYRDLEQARSMVLRAALSGEERAVAGAKAFVSEAARRIGHSAVQIHGGMGMTDELAIGHALKRVELLAKLFGDAREERQRFRRAA